MKLTLIISDYEIYYVDSQGRIQGRYKFFINSINGLFETFEYYKNGLCDGEILKYYYE